MSRTCWTTGQNDLFRGFLPFGHLARRAATGREPPFPLGADKDCFQQGSRFDKPRTVLSGKCRLPLRPRGSPSNAQWYPQDLVT